jgi:hypothetical protein
MRFTTIAAGLFLLAAPAAGQPQDIRPSHVPVPLPPGVDLRKLLAERLAESERMGDGERRLQMFKTQAELSKMLQQLLGGDPAARGDTARQLERLLQDNPGLRERLGEFARNNPEMLESLVERTRQRYPELRGKVDTEALRQRLEQLAAPRESERKGTGPRMAERPPGRPAPERAPRTRPNASKSAPEDPAVEQYRENIARNLSKLGEWFDRNRLAPSLRESPAVNHLFESLAKSGMDAMRSGSSGEGLDAQLAGLQRRFEGLRDWVPDRLPEKLLDFVPANMSDLRRPNFRMPRFDFRAPGMPSGTAGVAAGALDAFQVLLIGLVIAAAGLVLWRMLGARASHADALRRGLGPWPLDPAHVATRSELIQAFEYLSLLRCGEKARAWHHRAIAACLGGTEAERRAAAGRLAELYEQARYAPDAVTLPGPAFTDARTHLTYLAGRA